MKFSIGEISFIIVGLFAPASVLTFGWWGNLLLCPICAYAGYKFYQDMKKEKRCQN